MKTSQLIYGEPGSTFWRQRLRFDPARVVLACLDPEPAGAREELCRLTPDLAVEALTAVLRGCCPPGAPSHEPTAVLLAERVLEPAGQLRAAAAIYALEQDLLGPEDNDLVAFARAALRYKLARVLDRLPRETGGPDPRGQALVVMRSALALAEGVSEPLRAAERLRLHTQAWLGARLAARGEAAPAAEAFASAVQVAHELGDGELAAALENLAGRALSSAAGAGLSVAITGGSESSAAAPSNPRPPRRAPLGGTWRR